jgi:hypothetical protein
MIKGKKVAGSVVAAEVMVWVIGYRRFLKADLGKHTRACGRRASEESGRRVWFPCEVLEVARTPGEYFRKGLISAKER